MFDGNTLSSVLQGNTSQLSVAMFAEEHLVTLSGSTRLDKAGTDNEAKLADLEV